MDTTLSSIMSRMTALDEMASKSIEDISLRVRPGYTVAIREAQESLAKARHEYADLVKKCATVIGIAADTNEKGGNTPQNVDLFVDMAPKDNAQVVAIDANEFWDKLTKDVEPSMGGYREFGSTQMRLLRNAIEDIMSALRFPNTRFDIKEPRGQYIETHEHLQKIIRDMVSESLGNELYQRYFHDQVCETLFKKKYTDNVPLILVKNTNADDLRAIGTIYGGRVIHIDIEAPNLTAEVVHDKLTQVKKTMNKMKKSV